MRICVALVGLALAAGLSPPLALAAAPGPTRLTFDGQPDGTGLAALLPGSGLTFSVTAANGSGPCSGQLITDQTFGHRVLRLTCASGQPTLRIAFSDLQYWVGLQLDPNSIPAEMFDYLPAGGDPVDDAVQNSPGAVLPQSGSPWSPPIDIASRVGGADIASITVDPTMSSTLTIRSVAFSPLPQPVAEFTSAPPPLSASSSATFAFDASLPGAHWQCSLDGGNPQNCAPPYTLSNLADGNHYMTAFLVADDYDSLNNRPLDTSVFWTVDTTPPQTSVSVSPAGDFYPADSEAIELDSDDARATFQCSLDGAPFGPCPADGVYESLALGPHRLLARAIDAAGNVDRTPAEADFTVVATSPFAPPGALVAGQSSNLTALLGQILVFLQGKGFLPLTQAASIPIGTPIDARKGKLRVDTAASFSKPGAAQSAQVSAGIFVIRQQKAKRGVARTALALQTPAGQSRACAARTTPPKGVVRTLTVNVTKGVYRTLGAVAQVTTGRAQVSVQDTCGGTRVHVARGHASVFNTRTKRTKTVRAGHTLMIRARLFAARVHG